jgi:hypothetical protein
LTAETQENLTVCVHEFLSERLPSTFPFGAAIKVNYPCRSLIRLSRGEGKDDESTAVFKDG